jgi:hypothetical protein
MTSGTFATGIARTMLAALYGDLALHPGISGEPDIYGLFYARSAAMGWLTPATGHAPGGIWGMNDAEVAPHAGPDPACAAYFQVVLTGSFADGLLPVQPLLAAARDSLARLGTLRLDAAQILLPERGRPSPGQAASPAGQRLASSLIDAANWFDHRSPDRLAKIRVTLDGGPDPAVNSAVSDLAERLRGLRPSVFTCESWSLSLFHPAISRAWRTWMALAICPAFQGQQRSLRRMCQVLSWAFARSPGARSLAWAEFAAFCEAGLPRPRYGTRTRWPAPM